MRGSELLGTAGAAEILGVTTRRVRQLVADGALLPVLDTVNGRLFDRGVVERLAENRRKRHRAD